MSKSNFALAYAAKRLVKTRRAAPAPVEEPSILDEITEENMPLEDEFSGTVEPNAAPVKKGVDIGKLIKKHRFFGSKRNED